jgi:hypothetical protein
MDLQGQLQRTCDIAMGGYAGDICCQFLRGYELIIRPAEHDGDTGKQLLAMLEQEL